MNENGDHVIKSVAAVFSIELLNVDGHGMIPNMVDD
jgi:hypothetical protein